MPALYLFEKRTILGGDDLHVPVLVTSLARLVQMFGLATPLLYALAKDCALFEQGRKGFFQKWIPYVLSDPSGDGIGCENSHFFPLLMSMYLIATILFCVWSLGWESRIWYWTSQGTPTIRQPRTQKMEALLETKLLVLLVLQSLIVLTFLSATIFAKKFLKCHRELIRNLDDDMNQYNIYADDYQEYDDYDYMSLGSSDSHTPRMWVGSHSWWIASSILALSQLIENIFSIVFLVRLLSWKPPLTRSQSPSNHHELTEELWKDRCHWLCQCLSVTTCCLFGGQDLVQNPNAFAYYEHVARALADYLETKGTLDIVPTDLATGLLVLQRIQRQRILKARWQVLQHKNQQRRISLTGNSEMENRSNTATPGLTESSFTSQNHLPETTRLVASLSSLSSPSPPQHQPIFRRTLSLPKGPYDHRDNPSEYYYQQQSRQVLNPHNSVDYELLQDGAHMAKFALAIYTWMLYVFAHPFQGLPQLCCRSCRLCRRCSGEDCVGTPSLRSSSRDSLLEDESQEAEPQEHQRRQTEYEQGDEQTVGDNICGWHKQSLLLVAGIEESDLIYAQFHNRFSVVPYCIVVDHASQSVVLAVRGSLSLEDLVTDVMIDAEAIHDLAQEFGFAKDTETEDPYCHAGVLACAQNVYNDLRSHQWLERLLIPSSVPRSECYPDYQLRLVGHSLGAGICTLLGYMLRPRFPTLRVVGFSPPGCTMTWELATRCESWTTSFILDSDLVPRLSVLAMEELRDEVLQLIGRLKVPKSKVVQTFCKTTSRKGCGLFGFGQVRTEEDEVSFEDLEQLNQLIGELLDDTPHSDTLYQRQLQEFLQVQEQRKQSRGNHRRLKLYPPGRMIHLLKTGEDGGCCHLTKKCLSCCTSNSGFRYTPVYIANDDLDEIVVSPTMGTDHFVDRMHDELNGLAKEYRGIAEEMTIGIASDRSVGIV